MILEKLGFALARFLQKESPGYKPLAHVPLAELKETLRPGDVLLVEGNLRVSIAIKYLTQSTWSHAALYVGDALAEGSEDPQCLIEADVVEGVIAVPLSKYARLNTRICRPVSLSPEDLKKLVDFALSKRGMKYDMKNAIDLMRYLLPQPPVPVRWRRKLLALGSGDPTRAICSTLIAQGFESIRYPILPDVTVLENHPDGKHTYSEILHIRDHRLFAPRDFDLSPYFAVVKPLLAEGFDYRDATWG